MPTLREKRPIRRPKHFVVEDRVRRRPWTLVEKKKALTGLRRFALRFYIKFLARDVMYTSRAYAMMSVSVCLRRKCVGAL